MTCLRCAETTVRYTRDQIHCIRCATEVAAIIAADAKRRAPRFSVGKDLTRAGYR